MPATTKDMTSYLATKARLAEKFLDKYLPSEAVEPKTLHSAMRYSVTAGGKRLRPILAMATFDYCQTAKADEDSYSEPIRMAAAALEMVHTYSLIHDDLPCMDDDDLRRGQPTCHKKFGEGVAVLAGDALHVVAFELMARTGSTAAVIELAEAIGTGGMLGGQMADLEAEGQSLDLEQIKDIHRLKTAALIRASVRIGAILADTNQDQLAKLTAYGEKIGLAFQIVDDILDIEGDQSLLGKEVGSDDKNQKSTYPGVVGLRVARADANRLIEEALALFKGEEDNMLMHLARFVGQRLS